MTAILETNRLWLRQFNHDDAEDLFAIYTGADVMCYMTRQPPTTVDDVHGHLDSLIADYALYGFGFWAVILKQTGSLIGRCGLVVQDVDDVQEIEIAYLLGRDHWGYGYATEAAAACVDYGRSVLSLPRIIALIHPQNDASINVAQKLGLAYERDVQFHGLERWLYARRF